jgi:hypothetical protein
VGTRTRFYSPYWQVIYVTVPAGTAPDKLRSAKDVLDSRYPLTEGPGTFCSLAPEEVHLAEAQGAPGSQRPLFGDRVVAGYRAGWVEGEQVWYIDFGRNRFTWSEDYQTIDEAALFDLVVRGPDGNLASLGLPRVGGTGPFRSNTPARVQGNRPQFGALWRLHRALLPAGAGVFVPSARAGLRQAVLAAANQLATPAEISLVPPIAPQNEARADAIEYTLRAAVNPACFQDVAGFPQSCRWLDSQAAVEREIPAALVEDSGLLFSCPFLAYANQEIDP